MSTMVHYQDFLKLLLDCPLGDSQALGRLVCLCSLITFLPNLEGVYSEGFWSRRVLNCTNRLGIVLFVLKINTDVQLIVGFPLED